MDGINIQPTIAPMANGKETEQKILGQ